jgi:tetratricopeptide (TPR) repeat protein
LIGSTYGQPHQILKKLRFTKVLIFAAFCSLLLVESCSTTNRAPAATWAYQDITGHYNAYFNANEKLKSVYAAMDKTHKDNYKDVLPLYTFSNPKEAKSVTADLEDIEKRLTLSVQVHKTSNYADDDFVMMGKTNYIKGNYDKAYAFFKYTTTEYKNGVDYVKEMKKMGKIAKPTMKKKKAVKPKFEQVLDDKGNLVLNKIDQRPSKNIFIHTPARSEALLWLAKTYSAQKKYTEASAVVQLMRHDDKFYTNYDDQVELADAENLMNQKDYRDAVGPLEKFLTMTKKKSARVRPIFILAQIYERQGEYAKASDYYKQVLDNKPSYEMEFYAKIRRAKLGKKSGNSDEIKRLLIAMSKDGKYRDYLDQIYYELGEIVLAENNRAEARNDFHKSIKASIKNADQKALSYLELAQMDYEEEFYVSSKYFYDSTVHSMSKSDSAYDAIQARDKTLGKLVKQIDIITAEDSLQRIANMSPAERSRFLNKLIDNKQKEADAKLADKGKTNNDFINPNASTSGNSEAGSFYFYNVTARSNGYSDFAKKWGDRKLEDNWRRKDKAAALVDNTDEIDSAKIKQAAGDTIKVIPGSEEDKLMAGLPLTSDKMDKSNAKLIEAYYALGTVYKDDLQAYRKAILAFDELNKRFPKNKLELESFYQLYLLHDRLKNSNKADYYKEQILALYPNSTIAKYLKDPNYLAELTKKQNSLSSYYESAYNDYSAGLYASAEKKVLEVDVQFKENKIRAKFDILNAMSLAKENRLTDYVEALNKIISKYPGTPEKDQARLWLTQLNHSKLPQVDISKLPKDSLAAANAMPAFAAIPNMDTTGRSAFLDKMDAAKKDQAKKDAGDQLQRTLAAAKASADSVKNAPPAATNAKPYKPLTKAQRLDSLIKADKASKNRTETIISQTPNTSTSAPSTASTDSSAKKTGASKPAPVAIVRTTFDADTLSSVYGVSDNAPHYILIYFLDPSAYSYDIEKKIDNFNSTVYATDKLVSHSAILDKNNKLITVKRFRNKDLAGVYLTAFRAKLNELMQGVSPDQYFLGSISQLNYDLLAQSQKINNYMRFYRINYHDQAMAGSPAVGTPATSAPAQPDKIIAPNANTPSPSDVKPQATPAKDTVTKHISKPAAKPVTKDSVVKKTQAHPKPAAKDTVATAHASKPAPLLATRPAFDSDTASQLYGKSDAAPHYVIIYFLDPTAYSYDIEKKINTYNSNAPQTSKLTSKSTLLDKDNKLIMIKSFPNKDAAETYVKNLSVNSGDIMQGLKPDQYFIGSISTLNYSTLISGKTINNYMHFYRTNYK